MDQGVGLNIIQAAKLRSAKKIIAMIFSIIDLISLLEDSFAAVNSLKEDVDMALERIMIATKLIL